MLAQGKGYHRRTQNDDYMNKFLLTLIISAMGFLYLSLSIARARARFIFPLVAHQEAYFRHTFQI